MRLGQLSRKLGLTPSEIHRFLSDKGQAVEAGLNTRLTDDQVLLAVRHFDPSQESAILREDSDASTLEESAAVETVPDVRQVQENVEIENTATADDIQSETPPEVIRAPKQELPGLRVVGKIELKEPKKKETAEQSTAGDGQPATSESGQTRPPRRERPEQRTWRNPLEVQRQREAHEREEKLKRERELEKERRTQQYLKKVKSTPTKPIRKQEETVVETQVETKPAPKTWLGKIARWLTS